VGAALGLGLAHVALQSLLAMAPPETPRLSTVALDMRVLGTTLAVSFVVTVLFSMVPLWQATRIELQESLGRQAGPRTAGGIAQSRLRNTLVVAELALAVVLVIGAGLLARSVWHLQQVDPGFDPTGVLKAEYQLPRARYPVDFRRWPDFSEMHAFTTALEQRAAALPGVSSVAVAGNHPLDPGFTNSFTVAGREAEAEDWPEISVRRVSAGYFRTVGLALLRGRLLAGSDTTGGPAVALINDAAARRFFGTSDPIGARITFWGASRTIVGVVANERFQGLIASAPIAVYLPLSQAPSANGAGVLLARTTGDPAALAPALRNIVRELDPELAVFGIEPLDHTLSRASAKHRFTMILLAVFALVALVLAVVGVHGVLSYSVVQRTREIGIRVALGAQPGQVLRLVVRQGLVLVALGLAVGLAGAAVLTSGLASLLFGVTRTDPMTYAVVVIVLMSAAAAAVYLPTRRALRIDPVEALRVE
jgi:putative ABC transport system permease protein